MTHRYVGLHGLKLRRSLDERSRQTGFYVPLDVTVEEANAGVVGREAEGHVAIGG